MLDFDPAWGLGLFGGTWIVIMILGVLSSLMIFGVFAVMIWILVSRWRKNENSPRLTVPAEVVSKRTAISRHRSSRTHHVSTSTSYYVTFQVESGDRMELPLSGSEFGLLIEGDRGRLTFQGTRFLSFERN